jgi:hypothetical protein
MTTTSSSWESGTDSSSGGLVSGSSANARSRSAQQHFRHQAGGALAQFELDAGVQPRELGDQRRHVDAAAEHQRPDREPPAEQPLERIDVVANGRYLAQDPACPVGHQLTRVGELDGPGRAMQQTHPELALELRDLMRQRRLGDVQLVRRAGEVAQTADRLEVSELAKLHYARSTIKLILYLCCDDQCRWKTRCR